MSRYTNILLASMAAAVLLLSGTLWQSAGKYPYESLNGSQPSFGGSIHVPLFSLGQDTITLTAASDKDSADSKGDKKDGKDDKDKEDDDLKELWDSVQLG